jgi:hypothetical protein
LFDDLIFYLGDIIENKIKTHLDIRAIVPAHAAHERTRLSSILDQPNVFASRALHTLVREPNKTCFAYRGCNYRQQSTKHTGYTRDGLTLSNEPYYMVFKCKICITQKNIL